MLTAPYSSDDSYQVGNASSLHVDAVGGVLNNDSDSDGDVLYAELMDSPAYGSVLLNDDGTFTYDPDPGFVGSDYFTYRAYDGTEYGNTATVVVDVTDDNTSPVFGQSSYTFDVPIDSQYGSIAGTVSATDADGDSLTFSGYDDYNYIFDVDSSGDLVVDDEYGFEYLSVGDSYSFNVTVSDGLEQTTATVTVNIAESEALLNNMSPVFGQSNYTLDVPIDSQYGSIAGTVSATDTDGDSLTFSGYDDYNYIFDVDSSGDIVVDDEYGFEYLSVGESYSFNVTVSDGLEQTTATVTVNIAESEALLNNTAPVFGQSSYTFDVPIDSQYGSIAGTVSATDADGDSLTFSGYDDYNYIFDVDSSGDLVVDDEYGFEYLSVGESYSFNVTVSDGLEQTTATVTVNIAESEALLNNTSPVFGQSNYTFDVPIDSQYGSIAGTVSATDADGDSLTFSGYDDYNYIFDVNSSGDIVVDDEYGFEYLSVGDSYSFDVTVSDGIEQTTATVTVNIAESEALLNNAAPIFGQSSYTFDVPIDSQYGNIAGTISATDADGDSLSFSGYDDYNYIFDVNSSGDIVVDDEYGFEYLSVGDSYSFDVNVSDGIEQTTATVTVNIAESEALLNNTAPIFGQSDYTFVVPIDSQYGSIAGTVTATDADGDSLTFSGYDDYNYIFDVDSSGDIVVDDEYGFEYLSVGESYSFDVTVSDGIEQTTATVTVNISESESVLNNTAPIFGQSNYTFVVPIDSQYGSIAGTVTGTDADGDSLTFSGYDDYNYIFDVDSSGDIVVDDEYGFEYLSVGDSYSFDVTVSDGIEQTTATVTVNIAESEALLNNTAPVFGQSSYTFDVPIDSQDESIAGIVSATDADGDSLTFFGYDDYYYIFDVGPSGDVVVDDEESLEYLSVGESYSFDVTVSDGIEQITATVTVNIVADSTNVAPVAENDTFYVELNSNEAALWVLQNDTDADGDFLSVSSVSTPMDGTAFVGNASGTDVISYSPESLVGPDSLSYTISDGAVAATASVLIDVHQVDNTLAQARPLVLADGVELLTGGLIGDGPQFWSDVDLFSISLSTGDLLDVDIDAVATDSNGSLGALLAHLRLFDSQGLELFSSGAATDPDTGQSSADPHLTFTATANGTYYIGVSDSFNTSYDPTISGGGSGYSTGAYQLQLNLEEGNSAPIAAADSWNALLNTPLTVSSGVLGNDVDPDGDSLTAVLSSSPTNGTLDLQPDGTFTYTPNSAFFGPDSFTYHATDGTGTSNVVEVSITVHESAITTVGDSYTIAHDTTFSVAASGVLGNDQNIEDTPLSATLVSPPSNGSLTLNSDGSFDYVPAAGFAGSDSFSYQASDGVSTSDPVTVSLEVTDFAPIAAPDQFSTSHDRPYSGSLLVNDLDIEGFPLTAEQISNPINGVLALSADGSFTYTPNAGFTGADTFQYRVNDGSLDSETVDVTIDVVNAAPVGRQDLLLMASGASLTVVLADLMNNDYDSDGDTITLEIDTLPNAGTLTPQSDGTYLYVADAGFSGADSFTYTLSDGLTISDPVTVAIRVSNAQPLAIVDFFTVGHDQTLSVVDDGILDNDIDDDGDLLTASLQAAPESGTLVLNADGTFNYVPNPGFVGQDSFSYQVTDGYAVSSEATVSITVVNTVAIGRSDQFYVQHGHSLSVDASTGLLQNDTDSDGDALTIQLAAGPASGTLIIDADGSFVYVPNGGFSGIDNFTYRVSDSLELSEPVEVNLTVSNANSVATSDSYSVVHDQILTVDSGDGVLSNDFDLDGDSLTATAVNGPDSGTLVLDTDGGFSYEPNAGFTGTDSFTYSVFDGAFTSAPVTVTLNVVNHAPVANGRDYLVLHDRAFSVAAPGLFEFSSDQESDVLEVIEGSAPGHGTLTIHADGSFQYVPDSGYTGSDSFTYQLSDGVTTSDETTVTLSVFNSTPLARSDFHTLSHDRTLTVDQFSGLLSNDQDLDGDLLIVSLVAGQSPKHGTLTLNADGAFEYVAHSGFIGQDSFRYQITDGAQTDTADVILQVVNTAPVTKSHVYGIVPDTTLHVAAANGLLTEATDAEDDPLESILLSGPSNGTLSMASDGSFSYTPNAGFIGVDEFSYRVRDDVNAESQPAFVRISTALLATDDLIEVVHDRTVTGNVLDNDFDAGGVPANVVVDSPISGGTLAITAAGNYSFTPDTGVTGSFSFTYYLDNGTEQSNTATVTFDVVNTAPLAFARTWRESHGQIITVSAENGLASRSYDRDDDSLVFIIVTQPSHGTLTVQADGAFDYVPTLAGYTGPDSFVWKAFDGAAYSEDQTAWVELYNFRTDVVGDSFTTHSGNTLSVSEAAGVLQNDFDADDDSLEVYLLDAPSHGEITLHSDGSFDYVPHANAVNVTDTFMYRVYDGAEYSDPATVTIDVTNAVPTADAKSYSVLHDSAHFVDAAGGVLANVYDADGDILSAVIEENPAHGTLVLDPDGSFSFTPEAGYIGSDSFRYQISDGIELSDPVTVTLEIVNTVPVAGEDHFVTRRGQSVTFAASDLLANDSDADGDSLTLLPLSAPGQGTLTDHGDGTWTYVPDSQASGIATLTYQITDGVAVSNVASIEIDVLNAAPVAGDDRFELVHGRTLSTVASELLTNDYDLEADPLAVSLVDNVRNGTLTLQTDGSFVYTPDAGFEGRDSFTYTLNDGDLTSVPARVTLDVVNNRPTSRDSWHRVTHDTVLTVTADAGILDSATDSDDDVLAVSIISDVNNGTMTLQADGGWLYTPNAGFVGTDSFTYQITDGILSSSTATVLIEVTNTPVVAGLDAYTTLPDTVLSVTAPGVLQNDADNDSDPLTLTVLDDVQYGTLALAQDGSFTWTPDAGFAGTDSFTYRVSDGIDSAVATVQLTATGISSVTTAAPTAKNDYYDIAHSQVLSVSAAAGVIANDSDPDGDALSATLLTGPLYGQLTFNADGSFVYEPEIDGAVPFTGGGSFTYQLTDGTHSTTAIVEISVANTLPWAVSTAFDVHQGEEFTTTTSRLTRFAGDADSDTLSFVNLSDPDSGALTFHPDGSFSYVPNAGFTGTDSFDFHVTDAVGHSQTATVTLDVLNHRPSALDLDFQTQHDTPLTDTGRGVLAGAADRDGDDLTASLATSPQNGTVTLNADGSFVYTPAAGFSGTDEFRFRVFDGAEYSYESVVSIQVDNQAPTALPGSGTTKHGQTVPLLLTAFDTDGDELTYELTTAPQHGSLVYENLINDGTYGLPVTFTGAVSWQPDAGYVGNDSFEFRVTDGVAFSEVATVSLTATNFAPQTSQTLQSTLPGQSLTVDSPGLLFGASDGDGDALTLQVLDQPLNGTVTLETSGGVPTGGYTYAPNAGFAGEDVFTWRVYDGAEWSEPAAVTIDVRNNAPLVSSGSLRTLHGQGVDTSNGRSYTFDLSDVVNAVDPDQDTLTYEITNQPEHGVATLSSYGTLSYTSTSPTFTGQDTFSIRVSDGYSFSEPTSVIVEITNTQPTANDNFQSITHSEVLTLTAETLLASAVDFDGDTLQLVSVTAGADGLLTENNGAYTFNPNGFIGTTQLTYVVSDGLTTSEPATIEVRVSDLQAWALPPVIATNSDGSSSFDLLGASSGVVNTDGTELSVQIVTPPTGGTLVSNGNGNFTYLRAEGSTAADSFEYTLTTGSTASSVITAYIEDSSIDLSFDIGGQFGFGDLNGTYTTSSGFWLDESAIPFTYHDTASIGVGDVYRFDHGDSFHNGQLNLPQPGINDFDPDWYYTYNFPEIVAPTLSYDGTWAPGDYVFVETPATNGVEGTSAEYSVEVLNKAPVTAEYYLRFYNYGAYASTHGYTYDPDGDPLFGTLISEPIEGLIFDENEAAVIYTPQEPSDVWVDGVLQDPSDTGTIQRIEWLVEDPYGGIAYDNLTVAVSQDWDFRWNFLQAKDDYVGWYGQIATGNVLSNDFSADYDTLTLAEFTVTEGADAGTVEIASDGTYTVTVTDPEAFLDSNGITVEYTAEDEVGNQSTSVFEIKLRTLTPGQSAGVDGVSVINGTEYGGSGTYFTGVSDISLYVWGGEANVFLPPKAVAKFDVNGGDVVVNGVSAEQLWVIATGSIELEDPFTIAHANLRSKTGNIGDIESTTFRGFAAGDIGNLDVGLLVYATAGGSVGEIAAGNVQHVSVGSNVASVSSEGYINSVSAGGRIGPVSAAGWINRVAAVNDIESVQSGADIGIDGVAGTNWLGGIYAGGSLGNVTSGGVISRVYAGAAIIGNIQAGSGPAHHVYSVTTGSFTDISAWDRYEWSAGFSEAWFWEYELLVEGAGHILGNINAGGSIGKVTASGNIIGNISSGDSGSIGQVVSHDVIFGNVTAGQHIGLIEAGTYLRGNIEATSGNIIHVVAAAHDVNDVHSGGIDNSSIEAGQKIRSIRVIATADANGVIIGGDLKSEITATDGFIRLVSAPGTIDAEITAKQSIDKVTAGIDIKQDITSEESYVTHVSAATGSVKGDVKAETRIGGVFAHLHIEGDITAVTGPIESVTTAEGDIDGEIKADSDISTVSAGRDIGQAIEATNGSIGSVYAGTFAPGNIDGDITAEIGIGLIDVKGEIPSNSPSSNAQEVLAVIEELTAALQRGDSVAAAAVVIPAPNSLSPSVAGYLRGEVYASQYIGTIIVDGSVTSDITSGGTLKSVWAYGDVSGNVSADLGGTGVTSFGSLSGDVEAEWNISVFSYDDLSGDITSPSGAVDATTLGVTAGDISGNTGASIVSLGDIHSQVDSSNGTANATTLSSLTGSVDSSKNAIAVARKEIGGDITAGGGDIVIFANELGGGALTATAVASPSTSAGGTSWSASGVPQQNFLGNVNAFFWGGVDLVQFASAIPLGAAVTPTSSVNSSGTVTADGYVSITALHDINFQSVIAHGDITLSAWGDVDVSPTSAIGNVSVQGINVEGTYTANAGNVDVVAWEDLDVRVDANRAATLFAYADVSSDSIRAETSVSIFAGGDISAGGKTNHVVKSYGNVNVQSFGEITGLGIDADNEVSVFGYSGVVTGIKAKNGASNPGSGTGRVIPQNVSVTTWGDLDAKIEAGRNVTLFSGFHTDADVNAGGFIKVNASGNVEGDFFAGDDSVAEQGVLTLATTHGLQLKAFGTVDGSYRATDFLSVQAFGDISGQFHGDTSVGILGNISAVTFTGSGFDGQVTTSGNAVVDVLGTVTGSVEAKGNILVSAVGDITGFRATHTAQGGTTADASTGEVRVSTNGAISDTTIAGGKSVQILSFETNTATVESAESVFLLSHAAADPTFTNVANVQIHALRNVTPEFTTAADSVELYSFDGDISLGQALNTDSFYAQASGTIEATVTATGDITLVGIGISGTYTGESFFGYSLEKIDATVTTTLTATGYASEDIAGSFTSTSGSIEILAKGSASLGGDISATVNANVNATSVSLSGSVLGTVTTTVGNAVVFAAETIDGDVTAAWKADVTAGGDLSAVVRAGEDVDVFVLGTISQGIVSTGGKANVTAGVDITANVIAPKGIQLTTFTGDVTETVTASQGAVKLIAGGSVSASVTGHGPVEVYAIDDITNHVASTASKADVYSLGGKISAYVSAETDALVSSLEDISGNVIADRDAEIFTWGSITSEVHAGRDIDVSVGGNVEGDLTAARDNFVWAIGDVTGAIVATSGHGDIEAWGNVSGNLTAPQDIAAIWAAGNISSSTVTSGDTASVYAYGTVTVTVDSGADAYIQAYGALTATVTRAGYTEIVGFSTTTTTVTSSDEVDIYSLEDLTATIITADEGATLVTDGSLTVNATSAANIATWSLNGTTGSTNAGGYSAAVSWGTTNLAAAGNDGAYVWSYDTLAGSITSSAGFGVGISLGNNSAAITGHTLAAAVSGGDVTGTVIGQQDASVQAAGNVVSASVSGVTGVAFVSAFGTVNSTITGGSFAAVLSEGSFSGSISAADVVAFTAADLLATVSASQNVLLAMAGGNVSGAVIAGEQVGDVFAYGSITGLVHAQGLTADGIVHVVEAIGPITGSIMASHLIDLVRSGDAVTALLSAPLTTSVVDFDANVAVENPPLPVVSSGIADASADLLTRRNELVAHRDQAIIDRDDDVTEAAAARTDVLNQLSTDRSDEFASASDARNQQADDLTDAIDDLTAAFASSRALVEVSENLISTILGLRRIQANQDRNDSLAARTDLLAEAQGKLSAGNATVISARTTAVLGKNDSLAQLEIDQTQYFDTAPTLVNGIQGIFSSIAQKATSFLSTGILPGSPYQLGTDFFLGNIERGQQIGTLYGNAEMDAGEAALTNLLYRAGEYTGIVNIYKGWTGVDPITSRRLNDGERLLAGVFGTLELVGVGYAAARGLGAFKGPYCFRADTPVLTGNVPQAAQTYVIDVQRPQDALSSTPWLIVGLGSLVTGFGVTRLCNRKRKRRKDGTIMDRLFASGGTDDILDKQTDAAEAAPSLDIIPESSKAHVSMTSPTTTPEAGNKPRPSSVPNDTVLSRIGSMCTLIALITLCIGSFIGLSNNADLSQVDSSAVAATTVSASENSGTPRYTSKAIQDLRPAGDKVLADNPETPGQAAGDFGEFNRDTWRVLRMHMDKPDGGWLKVSLARPLTWIEAAEFDGYGRIWLKFEELGIEGWATVLETQECPDTIQGEGRLVTGRFEHSAGNLLNLFVDGETTPIGSTANHPFWSEDRREFVQAGALNRGERLLLENGTTATLRQVETLAGEYKVYNIEVDGEHVYFVGHNGLLVHNMCDLGGELLHGSGPRSGFLEVSGRVKSTKAVQNFRGKDPVDFRFDPDKRRFVMGKGGVLGHDAIPGVSSRSPGGRIRFEKGKLITEEWSGHYGHLWTPEIRTKFVESMISHGVEITHVPWGS